MKGLFSILSTFLILEDASFNHFEIDFLNTFF